MLNNRTHATAMAALTLLVSSFTATAATPSGDRIVEIDSGMIAGEFSGDVLSFKGIPYAAPPVGSLRWRPPQAVTRWQGVRAATAHRHDCMQKPIAGDAAASGGEFSEDCLYLSVWRPTTTKTGDRLPVLVWIHGGGFLNGGSSAPMFDGITLARQGLVVVAINYRLGRLGFFMHPALTASGEATGNYALADQLAALKWVQRNIGAFDGDAQQVTIAGESAGGVSVLHLLAWPAARGLFHRAIVMSGGGRIYGIGAASVAQAEAAGVAFANGLGITGSGAETVAALQALPVEKVNGDLSMEALITKPNTYAGGPIPDGTIVTSTGMPGDALRKRTAARVPVLIGTTGNDLPVVFPPRNNPLSFFGADAAAAKAVYFTDAADAATAIRNIAVDITMHEPARFVAKQATAASQATWLYRFGYVAESERPKGTAEHAKELPYLFGTLDVRYGAATTPQDRAMSALFMGYFAAFARTGDPNRSGLPAWPRYNPAKSELMMFTSDAGAIVQEDPWTPRLDLVERAVEAQGAAPKIASWLDAPKPASWNKVGAPIPTAPKSADSVNPRCGKLARPPEAEEDKRLLERGWDLVGAYHGGWQIRVIRGTAGYDGMCRPRQYQDFVFVRGVFAGTLSPSAMDSRTDGALIRVSLQSDRQLIGEYARYAATDPLCCPSSTTSVTFEVASDGKELHPVSTSTIETKRDP